MGIVRQGIASILFQVWVPIRQIRNTCHPPPPNNTTCSCWAVLRLTEQRGFLTVVISLDPTPDYLAQVPFVDNSVSTLEICEVESELKVFRWRVINWLSVHKAGVYHLKSTIWLLIYALWRYFQYKASVKAAWKLILVCAIRYRLEYSFMLFMI